MTFRTMSDDVARDAASDRDRIDRRCAELVADFGGTQGYVRESVEYVLLGGGKRLRPLLCLWTHDHCGGRARDACLDVACAIECIHTYSLVHDDLPCMDDDDMRRGRPSCHKKFGEAIAVLTGDALLTLAFEVLSALRRYDGAPAAVVVDLVQIVAGAAGGKGLITGQALDLAGGGLSPSIEAVERIHAHKTAALISTAMEAGAIVAGAADRVRSKLRDAGHLAGMAFQVVDDVLDGEMDAATLGKTPGKDIRNGKLSYPAVAGIAAARARAAELVFEADRLLGDAPGSERIRALFQMIVDRSH